MIRYLPGYFAPKQTSKSIVEINLVLLKFSTFET